MDLKRDVRLTHADSMPRKERREYLKREGLDEKTTKLDVVTIVVMVVVFITLVIGIAAWSSYSEDQKNKAAWDSSCSYTAKLQQQEVQEGVLTASQARSLPAGCPR